MATAASIAQHLSAGTDIAEVAGRAVRCAVDHVAGARWATVTTETRGALTTVASTDPLATALDRWHIGAAKNSVWSTTRGQDAPSQSANMTANVRWGSLPAVTGAAPEARAVLSIQLSAPPGVGWVLNTYADAPDAFTDQSENTLRLLAVYIGIAMTATHTQDNLRRAITSRDVIGQAKGMLMERYGLTADKAFEVLIRVSQSSNLKIVDIAEQLALTGDLPEVSSRNDRSTNSPTLPAQPTRSP